MIKVSLIGTGNVSYHLKEALTKAKNITLLDVHSSRDELFSKIVQKENQAKQPDIYIIAISDDAISTVSQQFENSKSLIVHTSGSVSISALPNGIRRGVFYPLQSFSKEREVDFQSVPICIEAEQKKDLELLKTLAKSISKSVYEITSLQRKSLHLAAVFINNFTNHMYQIGNELCDQNEVSFDILKPLIAETARKIESLSPFDTQTGPARRKDKKTIEVQLAQLKGVNHKEIYTILTNSILKTYEEKL